ncbi:DHH family phosphoesterase [Clostridium beijerinckii]|jgi:Predicted signaling protein consisting of a modified GGDEF domain and a DHH domain|uniref:Cyclic-di-AMP phosphodiesterase n=2 Tax=Clostridium beijerinckii TaxID=1520 RepID=A0A1S8R113_CLOBE|nr:DHH family phosphoesterase [Clostridium beijerinckii]ABR37188.1 phosphoesterase, RecJ domain protein [Clostridium beijerinckii NCIMB 8052]AIU03107.1 phosphoesterase domain-containing protein [Clostridium beijerinckii ATCC 35702]MBF7808157.1 DHH family phosphoesterase [Clostridium beijerinckii]NOW88756.1 c-di-AMP phosphodiesterase-like protein [Clostridium beijerinckii]NRT21721.1 c-di-AMP phosphodiesterase-like protein [Clostridium beijerinckii]
MNWITMLKRLLKPGLLITILILLFAYNYTGIGIIILVIYFIDNFHQLNYYLEKESDFNQFIKSINKGISENALKSIYPLVLIKEDGEIVWYNNLFNTLKSDEENTEKNILSIARGINLDDFLKNENNLHQRFSIQNKLYDVYATLIETKNKKNLYLLSFNDITKLIDYETTQESVMLIEVDNFTEVIDKTDDNNRPLLVAEIERTINTYANNLKAMIKRYDTNKYVLSIQDKYIEDEIKHKFNIMEVISKIDKGNSIEITLSIGVGRGGMSPLENHNNANIAKELALGRGGDQVVVKTNDDIKFFGGNSKEIEKRTKVKARVIARALSELIRESSKVYIIGHKNPDMDCFGSAVGLASVVKQLGIGCKIILNNDITAIGYFLNKLNKESKYDDLFISVEEAKSDLDAQTLVIIVDVHNKSYVADLSLVDKVQRKVIIDHHRRSPDMIEHDILNYIEVYASSTSEMVTEIIQYMVDKPKLTRTEAEGLLAGIFMDTKGFSFKTGVRTFDAASFLKSLGADPIEIKKMFTDDLEDYLLIAETIKSAEVRDNTAIAITPKNIDTVIIAKAADELLNISGISVSFVLGEVNNDIYISGRSVGDINVQVVLEALGGGGHMNIAGVKISNKTIEEVIVELKEVMKKYLRIGE